MGTFKFSSLFKESPCSQVVTFPSLGSGGHGVQPPQGDSFFYFCIQIDLCFFVQSFLRDLSNQIMSVEKKKKNRLRKDIKSTWQEIICVILLGLFSFKVCLFELLSNGGFNKGGMQKNGSLVKGSFHCLRKI